MRAVGRPAYTITLYENVCKKYSPLLRFRKSESVGHIDGKI